MQRKILKITKVTDIQQPKLQLPVLPMPKPKQLAVAAYPMHLGSPPLISSFITKKKARLRIQLKALAGLKLAVLALVFMVIGVPALSAFEAHVVNVTAQLKEITPPTLTPPGPATAWDNINGGSGFPLNTPLVISMDDAYPDASNIYYTFATGTTSPDSVPNPICGQTGPNGGGGANPQSLTITKTSVVKSIACDGPTAGSHASYVNTKIYSFGNPASVLVINEFLPNPTGDSAGNQGVPNGQLSNNGGEWVELFNNSNSAIDVTGFMLTDTANHPLFITATNTQGSLIMPPGGFMVVYRDGDPNFELNVTGPGLLSLFDTSNFPIDFVNYNGSAAVGKSVARVPDGSSNWVDPCPTPDQSNSVNCSTPIAVPEVLDENNSVSDPTTSTSTNVGQSGVSDTPISDATTTPSDVGNGSPADTGAATTTNSVITTDDSASQTPPTLEGQHETDSGTATTTDSSNPPVVSTPAAAQPDSSDQTPSPPAAPSADAGKQQDAVITSSPDQSALVTAPPATAGDNPPPPSSPVPDPVPDSTPAPAS